TEKQVGFKLGWGDIEGANRLIQMISHRQGFGDLLAEGVKRASEKIGGEAAKCAVYTMKGASPRGHDHRGRWEEMLDTCTSSTGTMENANPPHKTEFGQPGRINPFNGEEVAKLVGASSAASTSRTRSAAASSRSAPGSRCSRAPSTPPRAGTTRCRRPSGSVGGRRPSCAPSTCAAGPAPISSIRLRATARGARRGRRRD